MLLFYSLIFHLFIIILPCCSNLVLANNYSAPEECKPKSCGSVENISYPFWLSGSHPSSCGYSSLKIDCLPDGPSLSDFYGSYDHRISNIFHDNNSLLLDIQLKYLDPKDPCKVPKTNLSSSSAFGLNSPLRVSSKNKQLYFFNCSFPPEFLDSQRLPLDYIYLDNCKFVDHVIVAYVGGKYQENPQPDKLMQQPDCQMVTVPITQYNFSPHDIISDRDILEHLNFLVEWSNCSQDCNEGNACPRDTLSVHHSCVCPNADYFMNCNAAQAPADPSGAKSEGKKSNKILPIVLGVLAGLILLTITVICLVYKRKLKKGKQKGSPILLSQSMTSSDPSSKYEVRIDYSKSNFGTTIFTYQELEEATDSFNDSNELGEGGFGTVYKGNLRDGRVVAIKRLYENNYKRVEQFRNEIEILSQLKHQNLVSLYGCTSRHSRELLLVYEFVSNGTVADHLHGHKASEGSLTWGIRMQIAVETAEALQYLHAVTPPIIHRDVKTNNILLDQNFHVKVADFGLSRLFPLNATHVSTAPQGTPGYVDPEYYQCYQLTDKSDVYSFGVVLMELISSKPAVDIDRPRQEINLSNMATNKILKNELYQLVDPALGYSSDFEIKRMIDMVAEVAFKCLQGEREMRPTIKEVLNALRAIQRGETIVVAESEGKEDAYLLKGNRPESPKTVTGRWESIQSTPNNSS